MSLLFYNHPITQTQTDFPSMAGQLKMNFDLLAKTFKVNLQVKKACNSHRMNTFMILRLAELKIASLGRMELQPTGTTK